MFAWEFMNETQSARRRRLPSLHQLRAFEAAARHGSITRAAAELHVTQSAISHQVKALETYLGIALTQRRGRHSDAQSSRTFNMGIAMVAVLPPPDPHDVDHSLDRRGHTAFQIGLQEAGSADVKESRPATKPRP